MAEELVELPPDAESDGDYEGMMELLPSDDESDDEVPPRRLFDPPLTIPVPEDELDEPPPLEDPPDDYWVRIPGGPPRTAEEIRGREEYMADLPSDVGSDESDSESDDDDDCVNAAKMMVGPCKPCNADDDELPRDTNQPCNCTRKCYLHFPAVEVDLLRANIQKLPFVQRQQVQFDKVRLQMLDEHGNPRTQCASSANLKIKVGDSYFIHGDFI